jgi:hypothetical protein
MTVRLVSDSSNVLAFPGETRARPSVELIMELAPSRSLVDTLTAERGDPPYHAWAGFAREFAFQARTLEIGHGRDVAIMRLRGLVDAHIAHAVDLCRAYRDVADRMVSLEVRAAQAERLASPALIALWAARAEMRGHAIAARAAADGALGAAAALATYIREDLGALPVSDAEPRQLLLFATATG